jgi:hypothetical protein
VGGPGGIVTLEDSHGGREVVDATGSLESGLDDGGGRHQVVREGVVEVALELEDIRDRVKLLLVPVFFCSISLGCSGLRNSCCGCGWNWC